MIGVDIFFVISGFLISTIIFGSLDRADFSFEAFYIRRIRRIFPALLIVLLSCLAFGWFALLADEYEGLGKHIAAGAGFVSNLALWNESGYFDAESSTKPLLHLWSLGIEEQFYIVWPLLLWLSWKKRLDLFRVTLGLGLASFALNIYLLQSDLVADFYSPLTRFWELLGGAGLAYARLRGFRAPKKMRLPASAVSFLGAGLILAGLLLIHKKSLFPGFWALLPTAGAVFVIAAGPQAWFNRVVLSHRAMVFFGLISFPLYLWHWPLLSFARLIESDIPSPSVRASMAALSVLLAWATYRWVERPLRFGPNGKKKALFLLLAMAVTAALGGAVFESEGVKFREASTKYQNNGSELQRTPAKDEACRSFVGPSASLFVYCRTTQAPGGETIALIGDSHAHVAYSGLAEFLKKRGISTLLLANSGCPPFLGGAGGKTEKDRALCEKRIDEMLSFVAGRPEIRKVFLFSRGAVYLTGKEFSSAGKDDISAPYFRPETLQKSLQATIQWLNGKGKKVFYVAEEPELRLSPAACVSRPFRSKPKDCGALRTEVLERQKDYLNILGRLKGATIVQTIPAFCPEERCLTFDDGMLLYADSDHLSVAGSRFQAEKIMAPFLADK